MEVKGKAKSQHISRKNMMFSSELEVQMQAIQLKVKVESILTIIYLLDAATIMPKYL